MKLLIASHACAAPLNQQLFALAARDRGWRVTMVLPDPWVSEYGKNLPAALLQGFDADLIGLPVTNNGSVPLHIYRANATKILKRVKPDIVYSHNEAYALSTMQWCWANQRSGPVPFGFFSCQNLAKRYPLPFRLGESWVYRCSSFFFPITQAVEDAHRAKSYSGRSVILPLGYDPELYRTTKAITDRHRLATGPVNLAFVGRVVEEKGLITLATALGILKSLNWRLIIVGAGPFEAQVRSALESAGVSDRVEWTGFLPHEEVAGFFESVDLLVLPSETRPNWKEQFGRVMIESLACGTPILGSDSGEIPAIIGTTGGGLTFRERDATDLAKQLAHLIKDSDLRSQLAARGERYVSEHYSLPALAKRFADTLESVI